jgi:hypothetical protein
VFREFWAPWRRCSAGALNLFVGRRPYVSVRLVDGEEMGSCERCKCWFTSLEVFLFPSVFFRTRFVHPCFWLRFLPRWFCWDEKRCLFSSSFLFGSVREHV